jgi:hypothetical protein
MLRPILFLHRWLGVFVGLLMTIWCLSGFVMMYVDYPRLLPADQLQGLAPLQLPAPDRLQHLALLDDQLLSSARLEMMAGRPVLRIVPAIDPNRPITQMRVTPSGFDLGSGARLLPSGHGDIAGIATSFGIQSGIAGDLTSIVKTDIDQWTVQTFACNAPLYRADFGDADVTQLYISGKTGEVVQRTTEFQRFWGWLGAVPHWLYPTILRQNGPLWSEVVIWTSLLGCFLTVTGLWVGIVRLKRSRTGSIGSPFQGVWWWHHIFGLFFGIFTLTWVASGLFSMNPWGFLDSMAGFSERQQLAGPIRWRDVRSSMSAIALPNGTVRVETASLGGRLYLVATAADGRRTRLSADGVPSKLAEAELRSALTKGFSLGSLALLREEDSYYYSHKFSTPFPIWRATLNDAEGTLLYIDPESGQLVRAFDRNGRTFRWLQYGLHSLDFPLLRKRPIWDLVVVPLLALVTFLCGTGTWMGIAKIRRDLRRARRRFTRS